MNELLSLSDFSKLSINYDNVVNSSLDVNNDSILIIDNDNSEKLNKYIDDALKKNVKQIITSDKTKIDNNKILKFSNYDQIFNIVLENIYKNYKKLKYLGITGTNGKTTSGFYLNQMLGGTSLFVGTIDQNNDFSFTNEVHLTTPKLFNLLKLLRMKKTNISSVILEVSSHALEQKRLLNLVFEVSGFTNLSQDHLDYHMNMESYFLAKSKLFNEGVSKRMVYLDSIYGRRLAKLSSIPKTSIGIGKQNDITFKESKSFDEIDISFFGENYKFDPRLRGPKVIENFLLAFTMAFYSEKFEISELINLSKNIQNPIGRYQRVESKNYEIIIDFAHTPQAIKEVIQYAKTQKDIVKVIFGAGGNRDKSKRKFMGEAAASADEIIVSNDNPRNEDPLEISKDILEGIPLNKNVKVILDREEAINTSITNLKENEILLILGKGHEKTQEIDNKMLSFDDFEIATRALKAYK
ncbi:MAG: UDP-N-acetylmuramoyl-L-alanyl-D-glutamate--2,6-diaminopimelate ligase [Actinomycetota bacterium]|nr:UDP-N-acetylmuramoyl-L-alanyl-D-glutamate--2,6-diaminopimelate ligase [Actinomycetota bacterium]